MKLLFVLLACVAVTIIAAPNIEKEETKELVTAKMEEECVKETTDQRNRRNRVAKLSEESIAIIDRIIMAFFFGRGGELKNLQTRINGIMGSAVKHDAEKNGKA